MEQNEQLKAAVQELMTLLRSKLDKALRKQEEELKGVLSDYLQLITKLLGDKEDLTGKL
jgi:CRISPR/Cas system CSM-associated protein Csm2 small subunit